MNIIVTGARGFIGRHVTSAVRRLGHKVSELDVGSTEVDWAAAFAGVDAVVHLAGANRPTDPGEFTTVNVDVTREVTRRCDAAGRAPKIAFSSSVQAAGESEYGRSKRSAEDLLSEWAARSGGEAIYFRLGNVFGKWSRPEYNSVVATWCYRIARGLPYEMSDPSHMVPLVHVDDVVAAIIRELNAPPRPASSRSAIAGPMREISLVDLAALLESFRASRTTNVLPDLSDPFTAKLHSTYISFLPDGALAYDLNQRVDQRGALAEFVKSPAIGQIFVSRTRPGITRGDHFHDTKVEKFLVLEGDAMIRFRDLATGLIDQYHVCGSDFRVVDIPPGRTHHIENIGSGDLVVLFWASVMFDAERPDTYFDPVSSARSSAPASNGASA